MHSAAHRQGEPVGQRRFFDEPFRLWASRGHAVRRLEVKAEVMAEVKPEVKAEVEPEAKR